MPSQQDIERLAYEMWERDGKPGDNDHHYYYQAERALNGEAKPKKTATRKTATAKATTKATASKPRSTKKAA